MIAQLQTYAAYALLAVGAGGLLWNYGGALLSNIPNPFSGGGDSDDAKDFEALARLRKRFSRVKCPEGLAGVDACTTHFWHGTEGQL